MVVDRVGIRVVATGLLDSLGDRLADRQESFRSLLRAGEESVAVDMLVGVLLHKKTALTAAERDMVRDLLGFFDDVEVDPQWYPAIHDREGSLAALTAVHES